MGRFHQLRSNFVINCQSQLIDSIKQQTRLVSQRLIKLTGIGETDPIETGLLAAKFTCNELIDL